tara:strand:- start:270 stop:1235 length:966 start_codon:yes stop_codon:yes gene_type:complete
MALAINGTTGISGVDGSSSAPAIVGSDSNTGFSFASDTVNINTGGTSRVNIDSSGHLNMPTDSGQIRLGASQDLLIFHDSNNSVIRESGTGSLFLESDTNIFLGKTNGGEVFIKCEADGAVEIYHNNVRIITTGDGGNVDTNKGQIDIQGKIHTQLGNNGTNSFNRETSGNQIVFNTTGTTRGSISSNGSTVSFNTTSDYRLKENEVAISDGITRLKKLKPYRFNFKSDTNTIVDGFFAHEVTTAVPEAVNGVKDATETTYYDENDTIPDGKVVGDVKESASIVPQGLDQSKLVPLLTAALKEAVGKIETLETKVAALEAA